MAKQTKVAKRTKAGALPKSKRELTGKDMKKVKGGTLSIMKFLDKSSPLLIDHDPPSKK
jgi:type VI protein secretion system component Hcp